MNLSRDIQILARRSAEFAFGQPQREPSGNWMQTFSGGRFYPADPRPEQISIEDIARALSRLCRYAGHCEQFYSVAQHSVYVSAFVPVEHQLTALLHDATEAYLVDIPRPLKRMLPAYELIEDNLWRVIASEFGLPAEMPQCVKDADNAVLLAEKAQILKASEPWPIPGPAAPVDIVRMDDDEAFAFFMARYRFLTRGVDLRQASGDDEDIYNAITARYLRDTAPAVTLSDDDAAGELRAPGWMTWGQCRSTVSALRRQGISLVKGGQANG
jgi:uncharacterized protein